MAVYVVCPKCHTQYLPSKAKCPRCGAARPKGVATYQIKVTKNGKTIRKHITAYLAQAKEIEEKLKVELSTGKYIQKELTLDEFFEKVYIPTQSTKKSLERETILYTKHISPYIGKKPIATLAVLDIEKVKNEAIKGGYSTRTVEYVLAVLRRVINVAIATDYREKANPVAKVKIPKPNNKRMRFLTQEEANILLEALKKRSQAVYEQACLSLYAGLRFGEIANLKWEDIDFQNGLIYIKDPKNNTSRAAYLTDFLASILQERKKRVNGQTGDYVFPTIDGKKQERISRTFERTVKALGLNDGITDPRQKVVFHTLRHTFASWLAQKGTPLYVIKELLGHKTLTMTERYSHLADKEKRRAVESLNSPV